MSMREMTTIFLAFAVGVAALFDDCTWSSSTEVMLCFLLCDLNDGVICIERVELVRRGWQLPEQSTIHTRQCDAAVS